jgi:serine/threonine protein phosphatase PrpC
MNMITRWKKLMAPTAEAALLRPRPTSPGDRPGFPPDFEITAGMLSDAGCHRETNEDCCRFVKPEEPEQARSKGHLALVCDGMGGHAGGEVASRMAVEIVTRIYCKSSRPPQAALEEALQSANRAIHKTSQKHPHLGGMGTTCTALVLHQGAAILAQIGDSRLYLVRSGQIYLMSEDHSAVMEMVRRGAMSLEEARRHEDKNIILRALGVQPEIAVSAWQTPFPVQDQDCFVLCSDGLYDLVTDEEIGQTVCEGDPQPATERLTAMAKARGGYDNISVVVIKLARARTTGSGERNLPPTRELKNYGAEPGAEAAGLSHELCTLNAPGRYRSRFRIQLNKFLLGVSRFASRLHMCG